MSTCRCLLAFGANLGDPHATWDRACELLAEHGLPLLARSSLVRTTAVGGAGNEPQPDYLNGAILAECEDHPARVMESLLAVERQLGRLRGARWQSRLADLDLLLMGERVVHSEAVRLPHPRMAWRRFVLEPACQIAPGMRHPVSGLTLSGLLERLDRLPRRVLWIQTDRGGTAEDPAAQNNTAGTESAGTRNESESQSAIWRQQGFRLVLDPDFPAPAPDPGDQLPARDAGWQLWISGATSAALTAATGFPLVVWNSREAAASRLADWARSFPGALLDLADAPSGVLASREILAAVRSMEGPPR